MVTVPARFVNLLREALVEQLSGAAGDIQGDGHSHPADGIDEELLESFDAYRALLEVVRWVPTVPATQVEVDLSTHRWALESALNERLGLERYFTKVDPESSQYRRAQRRVKQIEAFIANAGLDVTSAEGDA